MKGAGMRLAYLVVALLITLTAVACAPEAPSTAPADSAPTPATTPDSTPAIPPSQRVPRITIDELLQKINSHADILIVDSRLDVEEQFDAGHIPGAIPVPLSKITDGQWLPPVDQNQEIIFYCT
jgi:3-mercaptopyruvate sulfurtransferase SseA